jgi:hypothetical protein
LADKEFRALNGVSDLNRERGSGGLPVFLLEAAMNIGKTLSFMDFLPQKTSIASSIAT